MTFYDFVHDLFQFSRRIGIAVTQKNSLTFKAWKMKFLSSWLFRFFMTCTNPDNFMNTCRSYNLFNGIPSRQKSVKYWTVVKFIIHLFCSLHFFFDKYFGYSERVASWPSQFIKHPRIGRIKSVSFWEKIQLKKVVKETHEPGMFVCGFDALIIWPPHCLPEFPKSETHNS